MKLFKANLLGILLAGAFCFLQPAALLAQEVIEDFERPHHWSWSPWKGSGGTKTSDGASEGLYGLVDPGWHYRTDVTIGNAGDVLSMWGKMANPGRVYLGFSASSLGAYSLVMAANTNNLIIQRNSGFGYSNLASVPFKFKTNKWYKLEVNWTSNNSVEGKVYDSDGTTLLATVSYSGGEIVPGGIAIRTFNRSYLDNIVYKTSCSSPVVKTKDLTVELDKDGNASITADKINNDSEVSCGIAELTLDKENFNCENIGENTVTLTITDNNGSTASSTATVTVEDNLAPNVVTQNITVALDENGEATITASAIDNGSTDNCKVASSSLDITSLNCSNEGENTMTLTVTDVNGNSSTGTAIVTVTNDKPQITSLELPADEQQVNTTVNLSATYTDVNLSKALVNWGDGSETTATFAEGSISAEHNYLKAGIYEVTLTISDTCGLEAIETHEYVIIFDPNAGFVTGGGWFSTTVGAWTGSSDSDIKSHVEFNSKYKKDSQVPQGIFNFTLTKKTTEEDDEALLKFKSTAINWLVIDGNKAYLSGTGKIDNNEGFTFLLAFTDGDKVGESEDYIRVQITNSTGDIVYENQLRAPMAAYPVQELDKGSLVIHDGGKGADNKNTIDAANGEFVTFNFYPNPAVDNLTLDFSNFTSKKAKVTITNSMGKVETSRDVNIRSSDKVQVNVRNLSKDIYIILVETDSGKHMYRFYKD